MSNKTNMLNFIAYIALFVVAILQVFSVLSHFGILNISGFLPNLLDTIKNACLCLVIGVCSARFVKNKTKGYRVSFWVCIAIIVVGTVLIWL